MKGLGANRSRHLSDSCEPAGCQQKPLCPLTSDPHSTFLLNPTINHYGTLDPHLHQCPPTSPTALTPDCLLPFSQMSNSSTFPRLHFTSQTDQVDCSQGRVAGGGGVGQGSRAGTLSTSLSMGMGLGLGLTGAPMITSGSATISSAAAAKMNRLPTNLLDQLERHLPLHRDGFSTLQFHRGRMSKQRSESPGRIRHLMHSVQKLFAKSQSLENSAIKGSLNGRSAGGSTGSGDDGGRPTRRSKSKDRAKTEGPKQRPRPNTLGLWSSDDALDTDTTKAGTIAVGYRNPLSMMTLGRAVSDSQAAPRHIPQGYNTISAHTLKTSKSSSDLKFLACQATQVGSKDEEGRTRGSKDDTLVKRGSWSTLTLSQARQVLQKGSATVNRTLLKSKSCHQDLTQQFLQVPLGDWAGTLGRGRAKGTEIPCRRMRSGSYVKAMGDLEDSEDSEGSPKPSPKSAARRQSYLKATQQSLSEQQPPPPPRKPRCYALMREDYLWSPLQSACSMQHLSSLPSLKELSTNRSLDNLDCLVSPLEAPPRHRNNDFSQCSATLGRGSTAQRVSLHTFFQVCGQGCGHSVPYCEGESQAVEALDLPAPTCFRSRSHSYLRAIQAGCSQDEDTASVDSESPPPTTAGYSYNSNTIGNRKAPPPIPPRTTSKPLISVTLQSSTESAQDTYLDQQDRGSEANSQSGRSNSSDSLCSIRTGSLAKVTRPPPVPVPATTPAPAAASVPPVPAPRDLPPTSTVATTTTSTSTQPQNDTLNISITLEQPPTAPKRKLSSIGIQVDCVQPIPREEPVLLTTPLKFQSIGVQVENGRPLSRDSSMASRQNTESEPQEPQDAAPTQNNTANCTNSQTVNASAPNGQDKAMEQQPLKHTSVPSRIATSPPESLDPALDPSSLPPPDPSLESGNCGSQGDAVQASTPACLRDGNWFLKLLQAETGRMEGWCQQMEQETKDNKLSEEVLGTIRSAVGSAQLLISQKFEQFRGLCNENLNVNANPRPTAQDLAGFWDLLQLSIEDISMKFDELYQLKANNWQLPEKSEKKDDNKQLPSSVPKKPSKPRLSAGKDRSVDSAVDKQRQEARKRLMAAKRAASVRQNSATESADSIEIYVPEAQTRL
ncbi:disks large-associated protein 4 isoform X2 [Acanthochromis polyacanthus]|uniref:disks large-associated protein 4 isoform X2 n=1 Tax=Acanthochromis polyacanthus TaxID=80966 RepID=UPI00223460FB|nr:disks large-associated protein 4 isoform X2 [Acanthochromis polyacanthus]